MKLGRELGTQLKQLVSLVSYDTFRRWIREAENTHTTRDQPHPRTGRPRTPADIRELVVQ